MRLTISTLICFVLLLYLSSNTILAQPCLVHGVGTHTTEAIFDPIGTHVFAQVFEACADGEITTVSFGYATATTSGTHSLRIAPLTTDPPTALIGGAPYQTFTTSGGAETVDIALSTPFPVVGGNSYIVEAEYSSEVRVFYHNANDYPNGYAYEGKSSSPGSLSLSGSGAFDRDFGVQISPSSPNTSESIPTLSEWGLIILALLLMTAGTLVLIQPSVRESLEQEG